MIWLPAGGSKSPPSAQTVARGEHFIRMEGKETYRFATKTPPPRRWRPLSGPASTRTTSAA